MKKALFSLFLFLFCLPTFAGLQTITASPADAAITIWSISRSVVADYVITSPTIIVSVTDYFQIVSVQIISTSPTTLIDANCPDLIVNCKGSLFPSANPVRIKGYFRDFSSQSNLKLTSVLDQCGIWFLKNEFAPLQHIQFEFRFSGVTPSYANREYKIYVRKINYSR